MDRARRPLVAAIAAIVLASCGSADGGDGLRADLNTQAKAQTNLRARIADIEALVGDVRAAQSAGGESLTGRLDELDAALAALTGQLDGLATEVADATAELRTSISELADRLDGVEGELAGLSTDLMELADAQSLLEARLDRHIEEHG